MFDWPVRFVNPLFFSLTFSFPFHSLLKKAQNNSNCTFLRTRASHAPVPSFTSREFSTRPAIFLCGRWRLQYIFPSPCHVCTDDWFLVHNTLPCRFVTIWSVVLSQIPPVLLSNSSCHIFVHMPFHSLQSPLTFLDHYYSIRTLPRSAEMHCRAHDAWITDSFVPRNSRSNSNFQSLSASGY